MHTAHAPQASPGLPRVLPPAHRAAVACRKVAVCGSWAREGGAGSGFLLSRYELVRLSFLTGWGVAFVCCEVQRAQGMWLVGGSMVTSIKVGTGRESQTSQARLRPRGTSRLQACQGLRHCALARLSGFSRIIAFIRKAFFPTSFGPSDPRHGEVGGDRAGFPK